MIPFATVVRVAKATALGVAMAIGVIALGVAGPGSPAKADWYSFSYNNGLVGTGTNIILTGELSGTVTSGTLAVTGFRDLVYNGTTLTSGSLAALWIPGDVDPAVAVSQDFDLGPTPFVTVSGSAMNLVLATNDTNDFFLFAVGVTGTGAISQFWSLLINDTNPLLTDLGQPNLSPDNVGEAFNASGWTLTPVPVPEPSQVVLLASAGVVFGGWRLRRLRRGRPVGDDTMADG